MAISVLYSYGSGALFPAAFAHHGTHSPTSQSGQKSGPWAHEGHKAIGTVRTTRNMTKKTAMKAQFG